MDLSLKEMEKDESPKAREMEAPVQELSASNISKRQRTETGKVKKMPAEASAAAVLERKPVIMGKPVAASALVEAEIEKVREILQNYLEICDSVMHEWTPVSVVDILHVLVRSLGMDVVSLALLDPERPGRLLPVVSRGYNTPPNTDIHAIWERCVIPEAQTINWSKLMSSTSSPETPLACWILHEDLHKFGYAPIHDGRAIYGFLITGVHGKTPVSPFSSTMLEMLGGRLGMSIGARRGCREQRPKAAVVETVKTLRDQFSVLMGSVEMLREANKLSQEEVASLTSKCLLSISESVSLLDRMAEEAGSAT